MKKNTKISIGQLRTELKNYHHFFLDASAPLGAVGFVGQFKQATVSVSGLPCVVFRSDFAEIYLRHVDTIKKSVNGAVCTYEFTCCDYTADNVPTRKVVSVECV